MQIRWFLMTCLLLTACGGDDDPAPSGDAGADGTPESTPPPLDGPSASRTYGIAYDGLLIIAGRNSFDVDDIGDPAAYVNSEATAPTNVDVMASQYYETAGFADAVERIRDRRPGVEPDDQAGAKIAAEVAKALQIGFAVEGASGRNSPEWYGQQAARHLDRYAILAVYDGLIERSAAGYDRALGLLWGPTRAHGFGALLTAADTACGTGHMAEIEATLRAMREPLSAELAASGLPNALDQLVIEEGASPEYDDAIPTVSAALIKGAGTVMVASLKRALDARGQAAVVAAYEAISADVSASSVDADSMIRATLDAQSPGDIDREAVIAALAEHLEVACE